MKLWLGGVLLRNSPSEYLTSPSHNFINIGPLASVFFKKMYIMIECIVCAIEKFQNKEGDNRGIILWHDVNSGMSRFIIL